VDEMPDAGTFANLGAGIDDGGFVLVMSHRDKDSGVSGTLPPCCDTVSKRFF
jgi:hypothetical protein